MTFTGHLVFMQPGSFYSRPSLVFCLVLKIWQTGYTNLPAPGIRWCGKKPPVSDTTGIIKKRNNGLDLVWETIKPDLYKKYATALFVLPTGRNGAILLRANPESGTLYKTDFQYFDQYTGKEIPGAYVWGKYQDADTPADYLKRMNYDIHTAAVWGLPGRIALFFASLIVASLPVTGLLFWWGRKHKRRKTALASSRSL